MAGIVFKGKLFKSKKALASELGIPFERLCSRIKAGWPEDRWSESAGLIKGTSKKTLYKGETFHTLESLAKHLGVSTPTLRKRIKENLPEEEWGKQQITALIYKGKEYASIKELSIHLGIKRETLQYRIKQNWPEDDWDRDRMSGLSQTNDGIEYEGRSFNSVNALARHLGVSITCLHGRILRKEPQSEWGRKSRRGGAVVYDGITYPTPYDLAKKIANDNNLNASGCARKLKEALSNNLTLEEAVELASQDQNKKEVEYLGETFEALTALSDHLGFHIVTMRERILKGWPEEMWALEKLPTLSPDFYFAIDNPEMLKRKCSVYVTQLRRFTQYQKIGIAVSVTHRRDAEYGVEHYEKEFDNRLEALIFESAIHSRTQHLAGFPNELIPPQRKEPWHGLTELRLISWPDLDDVITELEQELEEEGFEDFALRYISMSKNQRNLLSHAIKYLAKAS